MIAKARTELERLSADKKARYLARRREEWLLTQQFEKAAARRQGVREGLEQGLEQGLERGKREVLLRLVRRRFGELPEWVTTRLEAGSAAELDQWTERILVARDLDEMFG